MITKHKYLLWIMIIAVLAVLSILFLKRDPALHKGQNVKQMATENKNRTSPQLQSKPTTFSNNAYMNKAQTSTPMPTPILSVDNLLDESDRTDRSRLIIHNHSNLLQTIKEFGELRKNKTKIPTYEQLVRWTQTLINDAYLSNELGNNNLPITDLGDLQTLKPELVPVNAVASAYMNPDYLKLLKPVVDEVAGLDANSLPDNTARSLASKIYDLTKRRKEQSEVFYLTLMHKYFPSSDYSMSQKIEFARQFVVAGDWSLTRDSLEFFQDSMVLPENKKYMADIQQLISDIEQGGR